MIELKRSPSIATSARLSRVKTTVSSSKARAMTPILWQMSNGRPLLELDLLLQASSLRVRERFTAYNLDRGEDVINMCLFKPS